MLVTKAIFIQLFADGLVHGFWCALFETELEFVDEIRVDIDHTIDTFGLAGLRVGYRTGRDQVLIGRTTEECDRPVCRN